MTDRWASPQPTAGGGQAGPWASPAPGRQAPSSAQSAWWSDALNDPWRDPGAPAAVVLTPPTAPAPALETEDPTTGPERRGLRPLLLVALISALLAGSLGGTLGYVFATQSGVGARQLGGGSSPGSVTQRPPDSVAGVVKKVLPSVVTVRLRSGNRLGIGSGFVVSSDGYIVTNEHVVAGGSTGVTVMFSDGSSASARVVGADTQSDVAVLKVDLTGLQPIEFGDSDALQVGDPVLAIGSPLALTNTVTFGIVSALDRPVHAGEGGQTRYYAAIQTDAAVNQGNSGGPLIDGSGRVIGVNSIINSLAANEDEAGNIGLAFAIPINQARRQAQEIIGTGKARRTVLGAEFDGAYRSAVGGVRVSSVDEAGPAAASGLRPGDVLLKLDGRLVTEPNDVIALVRKYAPGTAIKIDYVRAGSPATTQVTLAADAN